MPNICQLNFTARLVRSAVIRFWRRSVGWKFVGALLLLVVILASALKNGDRSWYVGVLGTVTLLAFLVVAVGYFAQYHRAMGAFRRLAEGSATFEPTEQGFRIESAIGYSDLSWGSIREVWRYPDMWLLVFSRNMFSTLPLSGIDLQTQNQILTAVRSAGGRVA